MQEENRFFRWVYRLVGLGALLGIAALGVLFVWTIVVGTAWRGAQTVEVSAAGAEPGAPSERLRFHGLDTLQGTGLQMVKVSMSAADGGFGRGSRSSYASDDLRNIVFFAPGEGAATWLFPDNAQNILSVDKLCACQGKDSDRVQGLYLEIKPKRDGDEDLVNPALVRPDGSGYRTLTAGPVRVLGHELDAEQGRVGLLMELDGALVYRQYDLADFSQASERTLAKLPAR